MLTLEDFQKRYPCFPSMTQIRFDILQADAVIIMGKTESRWCGLYDMAQAALIGHFSVTIDTLSEGDAALPNMPVSRTDVDDVEVEFAQAMISKIPYVEADLYSTSFGQRYAWYRRMAFAGPRVV